MFAASLMLSRKLHQLSQSELALKLNVSRHTVGRWEKGKNIPDYQTFNRIKIVLPAYGEIEAVVEKYLRAIANIS